VLIGALLPGRFQYLVEGSALDDGSPLDLIIGKREFMSLVRIKPVRKTAGGRRVVAPGGPESEFNAFGCS